MRNWFFSLQFRLIVGFTLVLAMALGGASLYVGFAAEQESEQFQQELEEARAARIEQLVSQHYSTRRAWTGLQAALEQAGSLYSWRIVVNDSAGEIVVDTHRRFGPLRREVTIGSRLSPILSSGREVGSLVIAPSDVTEFAPEPSFSRLASAMNRSLLWTGLTAGIAGILLVSLVSQRVLAPVRVLGGTVRRLGQGDLSQRVSSPGRDEIGELGRTFNTMAEDLESAERQRRSLMADVAHELRTPLSNIQGYLEAVRDNLLQPDIATIETIYQEVLHLARLVEDLRLLALAESGTLQLNREPDSLEDVLRRSVDAIRPRAEIRDVSVSLQIQPDLPLLNLDRIRIAQVVSNLLENALIHTPEGGQVNVGAIVVDGIMARVTVADTGVGIPPEDLTEVFERFYRVDRSRARTTGGVGLGLTIAKQLVEAHGGTIYAESTLGHGSRFIFDLPLTSLRGRKD